MRHATRTTATWLGVVGGIAGLEHGYFAFIQGNTPIPSLAFPSWGPPCVPEESWHACEPAMSIIPNFLITGILAMLLSLMLLVWAVWFVQRKYGGWIQLALAVLLLLFGGGFFPPIIAFVGGVAGTQINRPVSGQSARITRFAARLWPWALVLFVVWTLGQFPVGHFFNDFLQSIMYVSLLVILTSLPLAVYTAYAHDALQP
ncbi:MAG: hypothetical protein EOM24_03800 [Chloroflexia bacterium]|nr:hypothetical protein [Chloroflexia bacterium]